MAPRLRVLAGSSPSSLTPISVNTSIAHDISSDVFEGQIVVHIKGFDNDNGEVDEDDYFSRPDRQNVTWSIQVQGRFLKEYSADDVLFGNTFDRPLKLPWGTGAVLKFMHYIDPTLTHDLQSSTKPWALSPLISTMPHFVHSRTPDDAPEFPSRTSLVDDISQLYLAVPLLGAPLSPSSLSSSSSISPAASTSSLGSFASSIHSRTSKVKDRLKFKNRRNLSPSSSRSSTSPQLTGSSTKIIEDLKSLHKSARRSYFSSPEKRSQVVFGPRDVITVDFCYGFLSFSGPSPTLDLPGGLSFDLGRYWDGQPVRFMCCERKREQDDGGNSEAEEDVPWGRPFWCVAIEMENQEE